ncbi:OmpA family protein [Tahibacter caeni]|uniref:OmpA family protein n=1 Tax=Tahibacter caeni TaxID=1453545 RepID=UPI002148D191|nr:OmpA family protein [Tahibacter caeni]
MKLTIIFFSFLTLAISHTPKASEQTSSFSGPDGITIHFKSGRPNANESLMSSIDNFSKSALEKNIEILKRHPQLRVELLGFTDDRECSGKYCHELSTRRVQRVLDWILSNGIPRNSVVKAEGKSTDMPIGDNKTEEGRAINRRVEFNLSL